MILPTENKVIVRLSILYFAVIVIYSVLVYLDLHPIKDIFGFIRIPILMILYFYASKKRDYIYFLALLFFQAASISFGINSEKGLFYGILASVVFRFLMLVLIYNAIKEKKWISIVIFSIPFLLVYLYLIDLVKSSLGDGYYLWLLHGFMTAFLGGLAVANYITTISKKSFWLLLSVLLFVIQISLFMINKFYLKQQVFLHLVILLYGISHYTFYKFMIMNEENGA